MEIQKIRKSTGMSQSKFAAYFGIPVATLRDWECGRRHPPEYVIEMIKRILELERVVTEME